MPSVYNCKLTAARNFLSVAIFALVLSAPATAAASHITLTNPNLHDFVLAGTDLLITWTSDTSIGVIKVEFSPDSGFSYYELDAPLAKGTVSYTWTIPLYLTDNRGEDHSTISKGCRIKVYDPYYPVAGEGQSVSGLFTIDTLTPAIETNPAKHPASFSLFPNPARSQITILFPPEERRSMSMTVYDIRGMAVARITAGERPFHVWNLENLSAGTYFIKTDRAPGNIRPVIKSK